MTTEAEIVYVRFARKPSDLECVQAQAVNASAAVCRGQVVETVTMTDAEYDYFTSTIYKDREWLDGKGGWLDEQTVAVIKVHAPGRASLFIDPSGYSYPRYVGLEIDFQIPPDPEGMNDKRAAWAGQALVTFRNATGADINDAVADLLGDLMHWCDRNQFNFDAQLERARWHYDAETVSDHS